MVTMQVSGLEGIQREMERALAKYEAAARVGIYQTAVELALEAERRTPVDTGELQESMYVTAPAGSEASVELGYGSEHAVQVHEKVEVTHDRGEAKYLQRAVDAFSAHALETLRVKVATAVEQGTKGTFTSRFPATPQVHEKTKRRAGSGHQSKRQMFRRRK